ncbi:MAG: GNAT family N-acetyltransferase [Candidatus Competibacteraceae bacterium]|nr:GNAT family N-acetyltransferase [Candidatus Competibacteraceae bacterium]
MRRRFPAALRFLGSGSPDQQTCSLSLNSPSQRAEWRSQFVVSAESLERWFTFVAEAESNVVAFAQVSSETRPQEFQALWVLPQRLHCGLGRALVQRAAAHAAARGQAALAIDSDPNAESFYLRCGARVVGQVTAPIEDSPNRVRPQLILSTSAT